MFQRINLVRFDSIPGDRKWAIRIGYFWYTYYDFRSSDYTWSQKSKFFNSSCLTTEEEARSIWAIMCSKHVVVR